MSALEKTWHDATMPSKSTIFEAIHNLNQSSIKIILVIAETGALEGTISDGDIRRGLLRGLNLESPISEIINTNALLAPPDLGRELVLQLMLANKIQQIPIVDNNRKLIGLHLWDDISAPIIRPNLMVIMAGGRGTRLHPYTENCPKPLLMVSGKPMLEHIINRAKLEGFVRFNIAINYLGKMIKEYFGDGSQLGVQIEYLEEDSPLGTAGALSLLKQIPESPFIVSNGDIISDIRYGELLDFHCNHKSIATMAIRIHEWQNPFGIVNIQGMEIVSLEEKPIIRNNINAGVYALDPSALNALPTNSHCDMPTLFQHLHSQSSKTIAYPMHESWIDVGRPDDLNRANLDKSFTEK